MYCHFTERIGTKAGIPRIRQNYIPQDEPSYTTLVSCKWALKIPSVVQTNGFVMQS